MKNAKNDGRLSKMAEKEAALFYENRRKELFKGFSQKKLEKIHKKPEKITSKKLEKNVKTAVFLKEESQKTQKISIEKAPEKKSKKTEILQKKKAQKPEIFQKKAQSEKIIEKPKKADFFQKTEKTEKIEKNPKIPGKLQRNFSLKGDFHTKKPLKSSEIMEKRPVFVIDLRKLKRNSPLPEKIVRKSLNSSCIYEEKTAEIDFLNKSRSFSFNLL